MSDGLWLGIDTGGTAMKYMVLAPGAENRSVCAGEVPTAADDPARSLARLADELDRRIPGGIGALAAAGMACAGIVDPVGGHLGRSPNLPGWQHSNLREAMTAALGDLPVALANDVNGALYGEANLGAGRGCRDLVMIALGTGVGGGVMIDGRLLLGAHHGAGEIGHMVLDPEGPSCTCGGRGCLEAWAGSVGLLRAAREAADTATPRFAAAVAGRSGELTTRDLALLAEEGDATARDLFATAGRRLGQAVGNLVNVLDPERVIIGGGVARAGDLILEPCRQTAPDLILAAEARAVPIVPASLGTGAAATGAALLAGRKLMEG